MKNNLATIIEKQDIEALVKHISNPTFKTGDHKNVMKAIKRKVHIKDDYIVLGYLNLLVGRLLSLNY